MTELERKRQEWEELRVAMERWRTNPRDGEAAVFVIDSIAGIGQTFQRVPEHLRQEAIDLATEQVYHRVHAGLYPEPLTRPYGFFRRLLYWRMMSLVRRENRKPRAERGDDTTPRASPLLDANTLHVMERLVATAISLREEPNKAALEHTWNTCKRWHLGAESLTEMNAHDCALADITEPDNITRAYNRLTRPQTRLREELSRVLQEIDAWSNPPLDEVERLVAGEAIVRLARCPKPRREASTPQGHDE